MRFSPITQLISGGAEMRRRCREVDAVGSHGGRKLGVGVGLGAADDKSRQGRLDGEGCGAGAGAQQSRDPSVEYGVASRKSIGPGWAKEAEPVFPVPVTESLLAVDSPGQK